MRQRSMRLGWLGRFVMSGLAAGLLACASPMEARAGSLTVDAGYDLFQTIDGTTLTGLGPLAGVRRDFQLRRRGGPIGSRPTRSSTV